MKGFIKTAAMVATLASTRCMFSYTTIAEREEYAQSNGMQTV